MSVRIPLLSTIFCLIFIGSNASAVSQTCLAVGGKDAQKFPVVCNIPELEAMEKTIASASKSNQLMAESNQRLFSVFDDSVTEIKVQSSQIKSWSKTLGECKKNNESLLACADLELDIPHLFKDMKIKTVSLLARLEVEKKLAPNSAPGIDRISRALVAFEAKRDKVLKVFAE